MPLVTVSALLPGAAPTAPILAEIARRLAASLDRPIDDVWVRLVPLAGATAGEDDEAAGGHHPTFELVTGSLGAEREASALVAVASAVAAGFGVPPEDVWGRFVAIEPGRLISGGRVA